MACTTHFTLVTAICTGINLNVCKDDALSLNWDTLEFLKHSNLSHIYYRTTVESIVLTPPKRTLNICKPLAQSTPTGDSRPCLPSDSLSDVLSPHKADEECALNEQEESFVHDLITQEDPHEQLPFECTSRTVVEELESDDNMVDTGSYSVSKYGDLSDEKRLISEAKCFASVSQLKVLLGTHCRHPGCLSEIQSVFHKIIGFSIKLEWLCNKEHRGIW